ncbi:2-C-methyl-D-erythritol 4-phosphate cytidylyltransferase [Vibrio hippocampi]|uniref:2-C-methyl-D-erythritol 4-phosphate cytidylyltransferase n=1 Tax=Vibrio hippocampi TaxID=654686 RepID=A0ABN8DKF6_9VIBR|nr:2-C-methyl-D-erythritol 4-phosphate cytidylyltransferase [Vibrio hippocampi]CAH0527124.1 2-C-methyl-D-erythritol 4-phosphate cytidylyltransferase [Vibrio hippocampi]
MIPEQHPIIAIVPAAGVGKRMQSERPKQYLEINHKTLLQHTVNKLLSHPSVECVVVAVSQDDPYYDRQIFDAGKSVIKVIGGSERADSVLAAVDYVQQRIPNAWCLVHDAARPCVTLTDISKLIYQASTHPVGGILASPVKDTMKRANDAHCIDHTVERAELWHALTPQMFKAELLQSALSSALSEGAVMTDEASAIEWMGLAPLLVEGRSDNIKVTRPEDLSLAEFYLIQEEKNQ